MAGLNSVFDFIRNSMGTGINSASWVLRRLSDNTSLASGTTSTDVVPLTSLPGSFAVDETTLGYPGPIKWSVTDPTTGAVRTHTSKSMGIVGAWRSVDVTRAWGILGGGVVSGLAVSTNGSNMVITVTSGKYLIPLGDHSLLYSWPISRTVTATAANASQPRIDTLLLRAYPPGVAEEGRIDLVLRAGTPGASPSPVSLTQDLATYWEVALADILVDAAVTSLAPSKTTDRRSFLAKLPSGVVAGDILYGSASGVISRLPKGTDTQYLKQVAGIPSWDTVTIADLPDLGTMSSQNASAVAITGGTITGITDLSVADGGTGASSANGARSNLGLGIGTDILAFSGLLSTIDALGYNFFSSFLKFRVNHNNNADTASTTSTSSYATALTTSLTLPTGTWTVYATGTLRMGHSAVSTVAMHIDINGNDGTDVTGTAGDTSTTRIVFAAANTVSGIGSGSIDILIEYRSGGAGTTSAFNPCMTVIAIRTAA